MNLEIMEPVNSQLTNSGNTSGIDPIPSQQLLSLHLIKPTIDVKMEPGFDPNNKLGYSLMNFKTGDKFFGEIKTNVKANENGKTRKVTIKSSWTITELNNKTGKITVKDTGNRVYNSNLKTVKLLDPAKELKDKLEEAKKARRQYELGSLKTENKLFNLINAGLKNFWMVGPAGCGKTTICTIVAKMLDRPEYIVPCSIGTSSATFEGYKYPNRETTEFSKYYSQPSIIVIDEFTALDPSVAQVLNSALANDMLMTTTGLVHRHPDCIIVATSNTFGNGASRQYVANNQLDASTIDRFVGGILEVDYDLDYESQYDKEVLNYIKILRKAIKEGQLRRIASTRMLKAGCLLKNKDIKDWKSLLIVNWTSNEKEILKSYTEHEEIVINNT
jgi:MoxR-like ATPase